MEKKNIKTFSNREYDQLNLMKQEFLKSRKELLPSNLWLLLNDKNISQLEKDGYKNFKITLALNYFTWIIQSYKIWQDDQIKFLLFNIPKLSVIKNLIHAFVFNFKYRIIKSSFLKSYFYNLLVFMLWRYTKKVDKENLLKKIDEPIEGNPPRIYKKKKIISQDLANSIIEYYSIMEKINKNNINSIMELGAGYGRTAYVFLKLIPKIKYIIIDIPPALYVAERYLSNQFREKKIFKFRKFKNFSEIKVEFEESDIIFLLPSQIELLPHKIADLFINISSFHEMRLDQIQYYFDYIDNLINKYIYIKQWKVSKNHYDKLIITEND
ncbi:MAG: putative sugar O-methyltransferase, partial [Candidatus Lokiarchaeota archaeon]|nr:putative sugar O-methyltransferase [Candidatus Lokiarchaeota archaeon]